MALTFDGSTDKLTSSTAAVTQQDITFGAWVKTTSTGSNRTIISVSSSSSTNPILRLLLSGNKPYFQIRADDSIIVTALAANPISTNTWTHVSCTATSSETEVFKNGVSVGTAGEGYVDPITVDQTELGVLLRTGPGVELFDGDMAEAAIWNVALTDEEMLELAAGYTPSMVRPSALVMYNPLNGHNNDVTGTCNFTVSGTTPAAHPPMLQQTGQILQFPSGAAAGGFIPAWALQANTIIQQVTR